MKSKCKHLRIKGKIIALLCMLILTVGAGAETVPADQTGADRDMGFALEEPADTWKTGSIMVHEKYGAGYKFTLYQVGIFEGKTAAYTEAFAGVKSKVGDKFRRAESDSSEMKELAEQLKIWADTPANKVKPLSDKETDSSGNVTFENLVPGYYLIVSESVTADNQKYSADPVLIALAGNAAEGYDRKVEMKSERRKVPGNTPPPTAPPPSTPRDELPNTGVLWWPVPILAGAGFLLLLIGRIPERKKRKAEEK